MPPRAKAVLTPLPHVGSPQYLRVTLGLGIGEWARVLGVAALTVHRWEHGMAPSGLASEVLRGIAQALDDGVDPHEITNRISLGIGAFVAAALTTKTGKRP